MGLFTLFGLPHALYVDKHSVFITTRHEGVYVRQRARDLKQFQRICIELGISMIYSESPEGRGRIERSFRTFQDRLREVFKRGFYSELSEVVWERASGGRSLHGGRLLRI
ncbi:MAG: hypothetical protein QXX12_06065 [Nanopusillaceae archaeon]